MTKNLLALSALLVTMGTAFLIAGVTSPSVVKACKELRVPLPPFRTTLRNMNRRKRNPIWICVNQGFFFLGFNLPDGLLYVPTPLENRSPVIRAIAGLLLIGGLGSLVAGLYFTAAACYAPDRKGRLDFLSSKRNLTGAAIQAMSVLLILSGLSLYTNHKIKTIGNPGQFKQQIFSAITGFDSVFDMKTTNLGTSEDLENIPDDLIEQNTTSVYLSEITSNRADGNATIEASSEGNELSGEGNVEVDFFQEKKNDLFWNPNLSTSNNFSVSLFAGEEKKRKKRRLLNHILQKILRPPSRRNKLMRRGGRRRNQIMGLGFVILSQLEDSSPTVGYSFYFLWTGCCSHVLALFIAIYNCRGILVKKK